MHVTWITCLDALISQSGTYTQCPMSAEGIAHCAALTLFQVAVVTDYGLGVWGTDRDRAQMGCALSA